MAKKLKNLELHYDAFNILRKSPEVVAALQEQGNRILGMAESLSGNAGFEMELAVMPTRAVVFVQAASAEAARECADHNVLLKAAGV